MLWRWWYSRLARQIKSPEWTFMNYGRAPADGSPTGLQLQPSDEADRLCIQLYERVVHPAELRDKQVLEVGSGRGGGASYIARYHSPSRMTGVDFSPQAVAFSAKRHAEMRHLQFVTGDAENLPFEKNHFDAVINVESSHCYGNVPRFFSEVYRVLRPGGWFLFADLRESAEAAELERMLSAQPWELVEKEDITQDVLKAMELDNARKRALVERLVPGKMQATFSEFAGLAGGKVHRSFKSGELVYLRFAMLKREA
jgi:ubiquinone/menaquinone biosynthesis C-methylase UbiE